MNEKPIKNINLILLYIIVNDSNFEVYQEEKNLDDKLNKLLQDSYQDKKYFLNDLYEDDQINLVYYSLSSASKNKTLNKRNLDNYQKLKEDLINKFFKKEFLQACYPKGFTLPELQRLYENLSLEKLDRRNFRRKVLALEWVKDSQKEIISSAKRKAKLYEIVN